MSMQGILHTEIQWKLNVRNTISLLSINRLRGLISYTFGCRMEVKMKKIVQIVFALIGIIC